MNEVATLDFDKEKIEIIKRLYCKGATDDEFAVFLAICKRTRLDPMMKQIYMIERSTKNEKTEKWEKTYSVQTSIDGFRLVAERSGKYAPGRESTYVYDENKKLVSATSYIKKMTDDGTWHEIAATAYWNEYAQVKKDGSVTKFWNKMPHVMLAKCAEALALRRAFPADLSGLYTDDEMSQSTNDVIDINPEVTAPTKQEQKEEPKLEIAFNDAEDFFEPKKEKPKPKAKEPRKSITDSEWEYYESLVTKVTDRKYLADLRNYLKVYDLREIEMKDFDKTIRSLEIKLGVKDESSAVA